MNPKQAQICRFSYRWLSNTTGLGLMAQWAEHMLCMWEAWVWSFSTAGSDPGALSCIGLKQMLNSALSVAFMWNKRGKKLNFKSTLSPGEPERSVHYRRPKRGPQKLCHWMGESARSARKIMSSQSTWLQRRLTSTRGWLWSVCSFGGFIPGEGLVTHRRL